MNETLEQKPSGISSAGLRVWGVLMLLVGIVSKCLLQNKMLHMNIISSAQLLALLQDPNYMGVATASLVMDAIATCAVPIFAFLLVQGHIHTKSRLYYVLRLLGLAVVCEVPYDLAFHGVAFYWKEWNPVFGLVIASVVVYLMKHYSEKGAKFTLLRLFVVFIGVVWCTMLGIAQGAPLVVLSAVLWCWREKPAYRNVLGCTLSVVCSLYSPFYLLSPMSFIALHMHNGEEGESSRVINYCAYPVLLMAVWLMGKFL